jgi:hypothetical protein
MFSSQESPLGIHKGGHCFTPIPTVDEPRAQIGCRK